MLQARAKPADTTELRQFSKIPIDVSLDGLSLLYKSCVAGNLKNTTVPSNDIYDENLMAESTFSMVSDYVDEIQSHCQVNRIKVYIDGIPPSWKCKNMTDRRKFDLHLAIKLMCQKIIERLPFNGKSRVITLPIGEAECECFMKRDASRPNILISRDSDLFHICYGYQMQTDYDFVYYYNPDWKCMYNMSTMDLSMPKLVFSTILFLKGSDLTKKHLSEDKCVKVFQLFNNEFKNISKQNTLAIQKEIGTIKHICLKYLDKEQEIQSMPTTKKHKSQHIDGIYKIEDIKMIVEGLVRILRAADRNKKYLLYDNHASVFGKHEVNEDDLKRITWSVNYSLLGARLIGYQTRNSG